MSLCECVVCRAFMASLKLRHYSTRGGSLGGVFKTAIACHVHRHLGSCLAEDIPIRWWQHSNFWFGGVSGQF